MSQRSHARRPYSGHMGGRRGSRAAAVAATAVIVLTGCGVQIPTDPAGTLDAVRETTLHAGASPHVGFVEIDDGDVSGPEAEAVEAFADSLGADVDWTVASEEVLVRGLEGGALDVVVAGLTDETPWAERAGMTRPYTEATLDDGRTHKIVMLVPIGENAFLSELETFLAAYTGETR